MTAPKATFWATTTRGVAYVRAELPARYLPGVVVPEIDRRTSLYVDSQGKARFRDQVGVAVWENPGSYLPGRFIEGMLGYRIPTLIDVDDNYLTGNWAVSEGTWVKEIDRALDRPSIEGHKQLVGMVDGITVASEALVEPYSRYNENVTVVRNAVDPVDWHPKPETLKRRDGKIRVGVAVSASHHDDLPLITRALHRAAMRPNVEVMVIGHGRAEWEFPHLFIPWHDDLSDYRLDLAELDIMLAPIGKAQRWGIYRSDLKVLEAGMAGAAIICSDMPPYEAWEHGDMVLKAQSDRDFEEALMILLGDMDETADMARRLRDHVLEERTIQDEVETWKKALGISVLV